MTKLFHTIVGVGIALGAATSVGCSSAPEAPASAEAALVGDDAPRPPGPDANAFCDATWPTTKGAHLRPPPACIDPTGACAEQGRPIRCVPVDNGVCAGWGWDNTFYSVCVDGEWECKPGKIPVSDCTCFEGDPQCDPDAKPEPQPATK